MNSLDSNYKVVSKYFTRKTVMDESLTDFQDKKSFKGPKSVKAAAKPKPKKAVKRIKGQKDIRAALKGKNELIAHAKAFDRECKKSGVDVDSEELQVAIALSKSLQPTESGDSATSTQSVSAQIRAGLIRSNLEAFGFKVPKNKASTSRKIKKRRKPYKLLLTTEEQKQQLISDRYSQLLFELNNSVSASKNTDLDVTNLFIYNMATNIEYKDIKDDEVFYVENLVEKTSNNMGCLLKNWSDIPGRPLSPTQDKSDTIVSEIECSQEDVDIILSGSLKFSRDILKKYLYKRKTKDHSIVEEVIDETHQEIDPVVIDECNDIHLSLDVATVSSDGNDNSVKKDNPIEKIDVQDKQLLTVPQPFRSLSPDLFDEDEDSIVENNSVIAIESPVKLTCNVTKQTSDVMDLTECVNASQKCINNSRTKKPLSQLSQEDVTKRKSNDFMEITECAGVSSQRVLERIDEHIDLTAHCDVDIVDKDCIDIDNVEHMDLTQSSNTSTDTLPFVSITGKDKEQDKSLEDTIILNDNDYLEVKSPIINTNINADTFEQNLLNEPKNCTSNIDTSPEVPLNVNFPVISSVATKEISIINLDESSEVDALEYEDNVDLTQTSESGDEKTSDAPNNNSIHQINNSSLGKKDDLSVDYDEALENMNTISYCAIDTNLNDDNCTNLSVEEINEVITKSKHSEVLEVSDTEDNSPNKNVRNNFDCGGFSVLDNLPSFSKISRNTLHSANGSVMDESLPMVDIKGRQTPINPRSPFKDFIDPISDPINNKNFSNDKCISESQTPKGASNYVNVQTPKQTEYIVKTDNVTPMVDYAAMSSPERNKELDKYGLKPFKRKRAIQLLTHLYNQTHPYVESTEELPSPSKRRKQNPSQSATSEPSINSRSPRKPISPRKPSISPRKLSKSPRKPEESSKEDSGSLNLSDKENDMFTVTRDVPIIRNIECDSDDWVFQKREKAKLHSCRVPLHIAFHNYVSCRGRLHEAILRYEPVSIDVIHKGLAVSGHRYDPKDLLKFMDKKCITVKTAENAKNKNHY